MSSTALGHDRPAGLLEQHAEVLGQRAGVELGLRQVAAEDQRDHHGERLVVAGREATPGALGRLVDDRRLLRLRLPAARHVGAVTVHGDEQRLEGAPYGGVVDVAEDPAREPHEPVDLGGLHVVDDEPLRVVHDVVERDPVGRGIRPEPVEGLDPRRRGEHLLHPQERVVAGRARAPPGLGQGLVTLEDLLDDHPGVARRVGEAGEVPLGVGQAVGVVDPEAVDLTVAVEGQQQRVGPHEHHGVLDAHGHQRRHVEEAAVVQRLARLAPAGETVGLRLDELVQRQRLGARGDGELVAVVAQDPLVPGGATVVSEHEVPPLHGPLDAAAEHGHEDAVVLRDPVDVEPPGVRRAPTVAQQ